MCRVILFNVPTTRKDHLQLVARKLRHTVEQLRSAPEASGSLWRALRHSMELSLSTQRRRGHRGQAMHLMCCVAVSSEMRHFILREGSSL